MRPNHPVNLDTSWLFNNMMVPQSAVPAEIFRAGPPDGHGRRRWEKY